MYCSNNNCLTHLGFSKLNKCSVDEALFSNIQVLRLQILGGAKSLLRSNKLTIQLALDGA